MNSFLMITSDTDNHEIIGEITIHQSYDDCLELIEQLRSNAGVTMVSTRTTGGFLEYVAVENNIDH